MTSTEPPTDGFETKDTRGTLLGYIPAELPHVSRTFAELSEAEQADALKPAGTPHAGAFDAEVSSRKVGDTSDSPEARRVGEGRYPTEAPAAKVKRDDAPKTASTARTTSTRTSKTSD